MKLKKILCLSLFIFLFELPAFCASTVKSDLEIKQGEYLISDYVEILEKTHSPYLASLSSKRPELLIAYKGEYDLVLVHDFHEFHDGLNIINGKAYRAVSGEKNTDSKAITISVDSGNLTLTGYDTSTPLYYIYVGDVQRFVALKVIAGDYADTEGTTYSFKEDGTASFGEKHFKYEIGLDFIMRPNTDKTGKKRNYFLNSETHELFEYEITDGLMSIYRTNGQESMDVETIPYLKIKKAKSK
jgi:hypothetical protein